MVYLHLSPAVSNSPLFEPLFSGQLKESAAEKFADLNREHTDDGSTPGDDHDDRTDGPTASAARDPVLEFVLKYIYKHHRYPEDDPHIKHLIANCASVCKDPDCPTRGLTGGGQKACKHTYPFEFRPPCTLEKCPNCGAPDLPFAIVTVLFWLGHELFEELAEHNASLYTMSEIITGIRVFTKNCHFESCRAVYPPHPVDQGSTRRLALFNDFPGIFFFTTNTLLVLPLIWMWLANLERNVAPFTSIGSWASQLPGSTAAMRKDRRFYDAFIACLIQVSVD